MLAGGRPTLTAPAAVNPPAIAISNACLSPLPAINFDFFRDFETTMTSPGYFFGPPVREYVTEGSTLVDEVRALVRRSLAGDQTAMLALVERFPRSGISGCVYRVLGRRRMPKTWLRKPLWQLFAACTNGMPRGSFYRGCWPSPATGAAALAGAVHVPAVQHAAGGTIASMASRMFSLLGIWRRN